MSPRMEYKLLVTRRIRDLVKVTLWKQCRNIIIQPVVCFFFYTVTGHREHLLGKIPGRVPSWKIFPTKMEGNHLTISLFFFFKWLLHSK